VDPDQASSETNALVSEPREETEADGHRMDVFETSRRNQHRTIEPHHSTATAPSLEGETRLPDIPDRRSARHKGILLIICAVVMLASIFWAAWTLGRNSARPEPVLRKASTPDLSLSLVPNGQDLSLGWKTTWPRLQHVAADVFDGDTVRHVDLTTAFQNQKSISLTHTTGNVQVLVAAVDGEGHSIEQRVGFVDSAAVSHDMSLAASKVHAPPSVTGPHASKSHRAKRHHR
jgi:hypothetical protein